MMINKRIGIDVDGVLSDWCLAFSMLIRKYYGIANGYPIVSTYDERITDWHWTEWYPGLTHEMNEHLWNNIIGKEEYDFWANIPILEEAKSVDCVRLTEKNHVYFITNRPDNKYDELTGMHPRYFFSIQEDTKGWLQDYLGIDASVIVTDDKGSVVKALKLDYFIDDKYKNCKEVYNHSPETSIYMPKRAYNKGNDNKGIHVIDSILEFPPFKQT